MLSDAKRSDFKFIADIIINSKSYGHSTGGLFFGAQHFALRLSNRAGSEPLKIYILCRFKKIF
jgi:hypothetical protein